ncbi:MAG: hypothetical protein Q9177_004131 [Variospora cf. flavescens]
MSKEATPPTSNHRPSQARRVCTSPEQQPHTGRLPSQTAQRIRDMQDALQQLFGDDLTARDMMMVEGIIRDFSRLLLGEYERHRVKGNNHHQGNEKQVMNSDGWSQEKEVAVQHEKHDAEGKLILLAIKQFKESD